MPILDINALLEKTKEKIPNPDIVIDPYDLTFVWVSEKYCELTGYSKTELINTQVFSAADMKPEELRQIKMEMISQKNIVTREMPLKTKTGEQIIIKAKDALITFQGNPYIVGTLIEKNPSSPKNHIPLIKTKIFD